MKCCFKCGIEKDVAEFYRHPQMGDGRLNKCIECTKRDVAENYEKRREQYGQYEQERAQRPERKLAQCEYGKRSRLRDPQKRRAHTAVGNAVRDGRLVVAESCSECGSVEKLEAHHEDYSRELDVVWLCFACHMERHGKRKLMGKYRQ